MHWYWWLWFGILVFLVILPGAYGWAYRRWGPPYPRYYWRRYYDPRYPPPGRGLPPGATTGAGSSLTTAPMLAETAPLERHSNWGALADVIWLGVVAAIIWAIVSYWWL